LSHQYPLDLTKTQIEELKFGSKLFKQGLFDLHEIRKNYPCDNCSELHEIFEEGGKYFYVCNTEHGGKEKISPDDVQVYRFNLARFLQYLAEGLNIQPDAMPENDGLWRIGSIDHKGVSLSIYLSLEDLPTAQNRNTITLTTPELNSLIQPDGNGLIFNKKSFLQMLDTLTNPATTEDSFVCGNLSVDRKSGMLEYKDQEVEISPQHSVIKFLILLMVNANNVVEYTTIAKETDAQFYQDDLSNKQLARDVQYFKRDLGEHLQKAGLNPEYVKEIKNMIKPKTNFGYKLVC